MPNVVADVLDELAGDFKQVAREPTTGSTESSMLSSLSRTFVRRAALLREADAAAADAEENRQAAAAATGQQTPAQGGSPAPDESPAGGSAEHPVEF
jgi:hypothetical protein